MSKDFNDFLNTVDYRKLSENTFNEISRINPNKSTDEIMYESIPEVSIKLLEKYHQWLNS